MESWEDLLASFLRVFFKVFILFLSIYHGAELAGDDLL